MAKGNDPKNLLRSKARLIFRFVFSTALMAFVIIKSAGTVNYWQGWVYMTLFTYLAVFTMLVLPSDLAMERMNPGEGVKKWDYVFVAFYTPMTFVIPALSAADAHRFHLSPGLPVSINAAAFLFIFFGTSLLVRSTWINQYFSSVIRIQNDRGQKVIQDGPYQIVRHPGYLGGMVIYLFLPPALNSLLGYAGAIPLIAALIIRTYFEDRTLQQELDGYRDYANIVKYRLIPKVW
jgi:protein-S-isoprenylcysteine O-methyltransferase Ste14